MAPMPAVSFNLAGEELTILNELLEAEQARLLVEIRHTDRRIYREELRRRLAVVEHLMVASRAA